jgi:hypothetical protein
MLKTHEYSQDYVCLCNNQQSYGRNCQQSTSLIFRLHSFLVFEF